MNDKEKQLLNTLYHFYSEDDASALKDGDEVTYDRPDSKHYGKIGIYKGKRADDGQLKVKFDNVVLYASPKYVKKVGKPKNLDKLYRILNQMVADGDLTQKSMDKFVEEIKTKDKRKKLDPYQEEAWDDEDKDEIIKPVKPVRPAPKVRLAGDAGDGCGRGSSSARGGC